MTLSWLANILLGSRVPCYSFLAKNSADPFQLELPGYEMSTGADQ